MSAGPRDDIAALAEALHDLQSHADVWRGALERGIITMPVGVTFSDDDRSYIEHEIRVFDRVVATLARLDVHVDKPEDMA